MGGDESKVRPPHLTFPPTGRARRRRGRRRTGGRSWARLAREQEASGSFRWLREVAGGFRRLNLEPVGDFRRLLETSRCYRIPREPSGGGRRRNNSSEHGQGKGAASLHPSVAKKRICDPPAGLSAACGMRRRRGGVVRRQALLRKVALQDDGL